MINLHNKYKTLLKKNDVWTVLRLSHFFGQLKAESNLKPISENLNYSAQGLLKTFPKYFNSKEALLYERNPKKIANRVYANRMGNGDELSGDGWKYRGRGFIQLTGKNNYSKLSNYTGIDYVNNPDLLLTEADAMIAALWYWKVNDLNKYADIDDVDGVSDIINIGRKTKQNGDAHGFSRRLENTKNYKNLFKDVK